MAQMLDDATARPAALGFAADRLQRIGEVFQADIDRGRIPGAVILVARRGAVAYRAVLGYGDRAAGRAMQPETIFRIASMTKPVTVVAALILAEEGRLILSDPVAAYLPAMARVQVGIEMDGRLTLEPARRAMTVQDLMRHTAGFTYGRFGKSLVKDAYNAAQTMNFAQTNAEMVEKLARLPLAYHPGTTWEYGMSTDVLGAVVETVAGTSLDRFIAERILAPLGMTRSGFWVSPDEASRLAQPLPEPANLIPALRDPVGRPNWISGGGGMVSTAADYLRFCQMLVGGGAAVGTRLLSPHSVALMASNHLPPDIAYAPYTSTLFEALEPTPAMGQGFGLGVAVRVAEGRNPLPGSVGDFWWAGATGTYFWIDPREQLAAVLMLQAPADRLRYRYLMRQLVYQALVE